MRFFSCFPDIYSPGIESSQPSQTSQSFYQNSVYFLEKKKMDSFAFDNVKAEKAKAMRRYNRVRNFANIVRVLELCVALFLVSWSSTHLPVAVKISGEYLRELYVLLFSTPAIFVIGNAIVITLLAQSGKFPGQKSDGDDNSGDDIYDEYVRNSESQPKIVANVESPATEENTYEDKQIVSSENAVPPVHDEPITTITTVPTVPEKAPETKSYRRTQSESFQRTLAKCRKELRRSETEKRRKSKSSGEEPARLTYATDNLSNEEFQRKIEAFIAKQQRFLRQEYMAVVLTDQN